MAPPKNAPAESAESADRAASAAPAATASPAAGTTAAGTTAAGGVAALAFEEALARLEGVVTRLEKGDLSLEQSLSAYEEGVRLAAAARGRLEGLQGRLEQLLADGTTAPLPRPTAAAERGPS